MGIVIPEITEKELCSTKNYKNCIIYRYRGKIRRRSNMACPYYKKGAIDYCAIHPKGIVIPDMAEKHLCSTKNYGDCIIYQHAFLAQLNLLDKTLEEFNNIN